MKKDTCSEWTERQILQLIESTSGAVAVDDTGRAVLVLPFQPGIGDLHAPGMSFLPTTTAYLSNGTIIGDIALLAVALDTEDDLPSRLVAFMFYALMVLARDSQDPSIAGRMIHLIRSLFERDSSEISHEVEVGLIGDLIVLRSVDDFDELLETWHVTSDANYDFSKDNQRLEVKTTRSKVREHVFSSSQIPAPEPIILQIASIQISEVSAGSSVQDLIKEFNARLTGRQGHAKFLDICQQTIGDLMFRAPRYFFDLESAEASLRYFTQDEVPTPVCPDGITYVSWQAHLPEQPQQNLLSFFTSNTPDF